MSENETTTEQVEVNQSESNSDLPVEWQQYFASQKKSEEPVPAEGEAQPAEQAQEDKPAEEAAEAKPDDAQEKAAEPEKAEEEQDLKDDPKASRLLSLAQKKEKQLKAREEQLIQKEQQYNAFQEALKQAKQDPTILFDAAGLTPDDVIQFFTKGKIEPKPEDKITKLEKKLLELEQKRLQEEQAAIQRQAQQQFDQWKKSVHDHIASSNYELIKAFDAQEVVTNYIVQHHTETGRILNNDEACRLIENEIKTHLDKAGLTSQKKENVESPNKAVAKPQQTRGQGLKTLSNSVTAAPVAKKLVDEMSDAEREAEVRRLLQENWN